MFLFSMFFLKQKTAYEMRISDWSSDVCSSDLLSYAAGQFANQLKQPPPFYPINGGKGRTLSGEIPKEPKDWLIGQLRGWGGAVYLILAVGPDESGDRVAKRFYLRSDARRVGKECCSECRCRVASVRK